jgi:ribosomal protein S18 acetylase RimI-like enzyme
MRDLLLRHVEEPADVATCFAVMRELRPHLDAEGAFVAQVQRQSKDGYRLLVAGSQRRIVGLAGYRALENLVYGRFIYVDDLVVAAEHRNRGIGARLLDAVSDECRSLGIPTLVLDTGLGNDLAQRFYFRYGMLSRAMGFTMAVTA